MSQIRVLLVISALVSWSSDTRADDAETIDATPMLGPAATIEAACALEKMGDYESADNFCAIETKSAEGKKVKKVKRVAPYQDLALVTRDSDSEAGARLMVKIADAWRYAWLATWSNDGASHGGFDLKTIAIKDVIKGGSPEIVITGSYAQLGESHEYNTFGTTYEAVWVCSVGASGKPSCAEIVVGAKMWQHDMSDQKNWSFKLSHKIDKTGRVTRKVKGKWPKDRRKESLDESNIPPREDYANTRTLVFP